MSKSNEKIYQWTSTFKSLGETDDGGINIKGSAIVSQPLDSNPSKEYYQWPYSSVDP